jgi:hypothetical protein
MTCMTYRLTVHADKQRSVYPLSCPLAAKSPPHKGYDLFCEAKHHKIKYFLEIIPQRRTEKQHRQKTGKSNLTKGEQNGRQTTPCIT